MRIKSLPAFLPSRLRIRLALILSLGLAGLCLVPPAGAEYGDVVLNRISEANDMRPVIFPHWFHRMRFRCKVCHGELGFEMRAGSNPMDMGKIIDGQYCGMCHNGQVAWSVDECHLCHSGKPGLKTGIRGSNQTGGPGRW
jgi:c(7)-type cytochrome triheme protein